jgi:hypothetical protein
VPDREQAGQAHCRRKAAAQSRARRGRERGRPAGGGGAGEHAVNRAGDLVNEQRVHKTGVGELGLVECQLDAEERVVAQAARLDKVRAGARRCRPARERGRRAAYPRPAERAVAVAVAMNVRPEVSGRDRRGSGVRVTCERLAYLQDGCPCRALAVWP